MSSTLLLDMNVPHAWGTELRARGVACVHWRDVGDIRATDAVIMAYAADRRWTVVTFDLDFTTLLALSRAAGPSIIQLRARTLGGGQMLDALLKLLPLTQAARDAGALVVLDGHAWRVRVLPL